MYKIHLFLAGNIEKSINGVYKNLLFTPDHYNQEKESFISLSFNSFLKTRNGKIAGMSQMISSNIAQQHSVPGHVRGAGNVGLEDLHLFVKPIVDNQRVSYG